MPEHQIQNDKPIQTCMGNVQVHKAPKIFGGVGNK